MVYVSKFSITDEEIMALLQNPEIIAQKVMHGYFANGKVNEQIYIRQIDVKKNIGTDHRGNKTSILTILTNSNGDLIDTFPGTIN